jgi:hypothetical protein
MKAKIKTYVLTVSIVFPTTHKRKGESTYFPEKILAGIEDHREVKQGIPVTDAEYNFQVYTNTAPKLHTIRSNKKGTAYERWSKKIKEVQEGKAILSIRYWSGKPYNSKQVEICQLDKDSGIGVQRIEFHEDRDGVPALKYPIINNYAEPNIKDVAKNDGLYIEDFREWFKGYNLSIPMAIIHFTSFRY